MLQVLHKILAIIIAFVVFFSSLSFTVEKHVCMGEVTSTSYFNEADSCGMISEVCDLNKPFEAEIQKEKCCNDIHELIQGNQNEQQALNSLELDQLQFILTFTYTYLNLFEDTADLNLANIYSPPLVDRDINVLYQTFLI
jgi:hypothetical protein